MPIRKGTILELTASGHDDTGKILIDDADHGPVFVYADLAPTLKTLQGLYGNVVDAGKRTVRLESFVGEEVYYGLDAFGTLALLTPAEQASSEVVRTYEEGKRKAVAG